MVLTLLIEDHIGYSSTDKEMGRSCERVSDLQLIRCHED